MENLHLVPKAFTRPGLYSASWAHRGGGDRSAWVSHMRVVRNVRLLGEIPKPEPINPKGLKPDWGFGFKELYGFGALI